MDGIGASAAAEEQQTGEALRALARELQMQAEAVDMVRGRLAAAQMIDWESPAGRNFRSYLQERSVHLGGTVHLLLEAALWVEGFASALSAADAARSAGV